MAKEKAAPIGAGAGDAGTVRELDNITCLMQWAKLFGEAMEELGWKSSFDAIKEQALFYMDEDNRPTLVTDIADRTDYRKLMVAAAQGRLFVRSKDGDGMVQIQTKANAPKAEDPYMFFGKSPEWIRMTTESMQAERLEIDLTRPLKELPLQPVAMEKPSIWKYILFFIFGDEIKAYQDHCGAVKSHNEALNKWGAVESFRQSFAPVVEQMKRDADMEKQQVKKVWAEDPVVTNTINYCKDVAEFNVQLDDGVDLGENEDAVEGLEFLREVHRDGMSVKAEMLEEIFNDKLSGRSREDILDRLARIMLAEQMEENVRQHNAACKETGVWTVNPLYEAVGMDGSFFDMMVKKIARTPTVAEMASMKPSQLIKLLASPSQLQVKVANVIAETSEDGMSLVDDGAAGMKMNEIGIEGEVREGNLPSNQRSIPGQGNGGIQMNI